MSMRFLALICALCLLCSGCGAAVPPADSQSSVASSTQTAPVAPPVPTPSSEPAPNPQEPAPNPQEPVPEPQKPAPEPQEPVPEPQEPVPEPPEPVQPVWEPSVPAIHIPDHPVYDFSAPVPEHPGVENDYFADAAFVGDSRTEGFWLYSGVKQGKLLSAVGLTVFSVDTKLATGSSQTVLDSLCAGHFNKIYLGFGLNELGYIDTNSFVRTYCELIDTIRAAQPQAIIYLQNLMPVNDALARASGLQGHVNCERIQLYNGFIAQIAQEKQLPLLDLYSAFVVDGQLPAEASSDGVHLHPSHCKKQLNFFKTHTVTPEQLTASAVPAEPVPSGPVEVPTPESPTEPNTEVPEI